MSTRSRFCRCAVLHVRPRLRLPRRARRRRPQWLRLHSPLHPCLSRRSRDRPRAARHPSPCRLLLKSRPPVMYRRARRRQLNRLKLRPPRRPGWPAGRVSRRRLRSLRCRLASHRGLLCRASARWNPISLGRLCCRPRSPRRLPPGPRFLRRVTLWAQPSREPSRLRHRSRKSIAGQQANRKRPIRRVRIPARGVICCFRWPLRC